jgi:hypothetical protein
MTVSSLPEVALVTEIVDAGPGGATCPHCGSLGRWVICFVDVYGKEGGAMKGCWKLFPKSAFVAKCEKLLSKEAKARDGIEKLNKWDIAQLDALQDLKKEIITLNQAIGIIRSADLDKKNWMKKRGYCR